MRPETVASVTFTGREQAELVSRPLDPSPLGPQEVAGPSLATLVSPGTEINAGYLGERFPYSPGYAAVFEVAEVGSEVTDLRPGDRAFTMGHHRGWQRASRHAVVPVPADLDPAVAVFARLMAVSMTTLVTTRARPPAPIAVSGLGPVGHLAAQLFAGCGYEVIGVDPVAGRRELLAERGVTRVYPALPADDPAVRDRLHLVVECSGHEDAVIAACGLVRKGGEVVMIGVPWRRRSDALAFDLLSLVFHRYVHLRSGWEWELPREPRDFVAGDVRSNWQGAFRWLAEGRVKVHGLAATAPPAACQEVYQALLHRPEERLVGLFDWT